MGSISWPVRLTGTPQRRANEFIDSSFPHNYNLGSTVLFIGIVRRRAVTCTTVLVLVLRPCAVAWGGGGHRVLEGGPGAWRWPRSGTTDVLEARVRGQWTAHLLSGGLFLLGRQLLRTWPTTAATLPPR